MFPGVGFLGLDLYMLMILVGIVAAIVFYSIYSDRMKLAGKVFNLSLIVAIAAVVLGFLSAILVQSFYNYVETGIWIWKGMTFYGGLIGAIVTFMILYFSVGHFLFKDKKHISEFNKMLSCIMPCIVVAHALGRIGCLFAGCCHGAHTDSWIGITMPGAGEGKYVPIQLFEAIFLFALFGFLSFMLLKKKSEYTTSMYLVLYGVWRFVIEFWRGDDRGSVGLGISPSQLTAIIMVVIGAGLFFLHKYLMKGVYNKIAVKYENPKE